MTMMDAKIEAAVLAEGLLARLEMEDSLGAGYLPIALPAPMKHAPPTAPTTPPPDTHTPPHPGAAPTTTTRGASASQPSPAPRPDAPRVQHAPPPPTAQVQPALTGSAERIDAIAACVGDALACRKCRLCADRRQVVFGEGSLDAEVVFVGDMPGREEDLQGRPFQGLTGGLLTQIIEGAFSRSRAEVYLTTLLKCRPKGSRVPRQDEADACLPYFRRELEVIRPRVLVVFGEQAARFLQGGDGAEPFEPGTWFAFGGGDVMPTFSLATIQRERRHQGRGNEYDKAVWQHLQKVLRRLQGG